MAPCEFFNLVKRLLMGHGLPAEVFPDRQRVPVQEGSDFSDGKILFPHILPKPFSKFAHYGLLRII